MRNLIFIFLILLNPLQNWGQELSFDEAINCLRNKDIIERNMLKKGFRLIEQSSSNTYTFPVTVTDKLREQLIGFGYNFFPIGTVHYHVPYTQDFSGYNEERKEVILNNLKDTIPTSFLQNKISTYSTFAHNFNHIDKTASDWYHFKKEKCVTIFGEIDHCTFGMNTTLSIEFFDELKFNDWSKVIDSKCKFKGTDTFNNESSYHYEFQDILIELVNFTDENRFSIEFILPTPR
jgi:hypothetical protein